jgi:hypothetical protein
MSQQEKAAYYKALKDSGVEFSKHYREYSTDELKAAYTKLAEGQQQQSHDEDFQQLEYPPAQQAQGQGAFAPPLSDLPPVQSSPVPPPPAPSTPIDSPEEEAPSDFFGLQHTRPKPPIRPADPEEMAGQRQNTQDLDEPIRTDEQGRVWYQEEVRKPAFPKPRGRRVLTYMDSGVEQQTVKSGDYVETFEVAGRGPARATEVKVTLPSYQVGIFRDPRFPFRIHVYNDVMGFDLFEVQDFYGGAELVPAECKRMYVENVLCYDIRTTVRAIEAEYRRLQLAGKVD